MKRLTCEMCGSTDLIKQDGVFVCQSCGCKYSVEEAKKMMIEGTVEVTGNVEVSGTVKMDNTDSIDNALTLARNAIDGNNLTEAEKYCNRVIEMDKDNWEAWFIKGKAVGWLSNLENIRLPEVVNAFAQTLACCPEDKRDKLSKNCTDQLESLQTAIISSRMSCFSPHPTLTMMGALHDDVNGILSAVNDFYVKTGLKIEVIGNINYAVIVMNGAYNAWRPVKLNYSSTKYPSDSVWLRFVNEGDVLLNALSTALMLCGNRDDDVDLVKTEQQIYRYMIEIDKEIRGSQSYSINMNKSGKKCYVPSKTITRESKRARQKDISEWKSIVSDIDKTGIQKAFEAEDRKRREYWEKNSDLKKSLDDERASLVGQISSTNEKLAAEPEQAELEEVRKRIDDLTAEKKSYNVMKIKERKAVQEKIDSACGEESEILSRLAPKEKAAEDKISHLQGRIDEIDNEFRKKR